MLGDWLKPGGTKVVSTEWVRNIYLHRSSTQGVLAGLVTLRQPRKCAVGVICGRQPCKSFTWAQRATSIDHTTPSAPTGAAKLLCVWSAAPSMELRGQAWLCLPLLAADTSPPDAGVHTCAWIGWELSGLPHSFRKQSDESTDPEWNDLLAWPSCPCSWGCAVDFGKNPPS